MVMITVDDFCPTYSAYFSSPVTPEPCEEDDDPEAEASSPDFEPGTEIDQGLSSPFAIYLLRYHSAFRKVT